LLDSINKIIGPEYILDTDMSPYHSYNSFQQIDLDGDGTKEIIIAASKTDSTKETNKIFILKRQNHVLKILDSSAAYEVDGRGPQVEVNGDTLTVIHSFHRGSSSITYIYNSKVHRYILSNVFYSGITPNVPYDGTYSYGSQSYDIKNSALTAISYEGDYGSGDRRKLKKTITHKKMPKGLSLKLSNMKDPYDGYDDVF